MRLKAAWQRLAALSLAAATCLSTIDGARAWETTLHEFEQPEGWFLLAPLVADADNTLFGLASSGGNNGCFRQGCGTVFKIKPALVGNPFGATATPTIIYRFQNKSDGSSPVAVIPDGQGGLYGSTQNGGVVTSECDSGCGMIFHLAPPAPGRTDWSYTVIYRFKGGRDGEFPVGRLVMDKQGALYGLTSNGGGGNACAAWAFQPSCGVVFQLQPMNAAKTVWRETVLYRFTGGRGGGIPNGELAIDPASGTLYGTTWYGGHNATTDCCGIVFRLTSPAQEGGDWRFTTLFRFSGADGSGPAGALALDKGVLYGATTFGGAFGHGAVFRLTPPASRDAPWINTTLHSTSFAEGDRLESGVTRAADGTLYVVGHNGGNKTGAMPACAQHGCGTVFKLVPPADPSGQWHYVSLHRFSGADGAGPSTAVTLLGHHVFGATWAGGDLAACKFFFLGTYGCGVVFDVGP